MTTDQVESVLDNPTYKIVEVDFDPESYPEGHLRNAVCWNWSTELRDPTTHEVVSPEVFANLLAESGIGRDTHVVLYGDNNNWFACWAYWLLFMIGHKNVWLMDGGRRKWFAEEREITSAVPEYQPADYPVPTYDTGNRATVEQLFEAMFSPDSHRILDVRSAAEFEGRILGPEGVTANCAVGGHIPGAINVPWNLNCNSDGTFKGREALKELYASFDVQNTDHVVTYCAIGERASLSWFVLKMLLGLEFVMNYDRSMAQWSRLANAPTARRNAA